MLKGAKNHDLLDRLLGCVYGQALGDAYGLSTEFEDRHRVAHDYPDSSELIPFPDYKLTGHSSRWRRGDWTDDTDQWILILETLTENNGDEKVFAAKLENWIHRGFPELNDWAGLGLGANVSQVDTRLLRVRHGIEVSTSRWFDRRIFGRSPTKQVKWFGNEATVKLHRTER